MKSKEDKRKKMSRGKVDKCAEEATTPIITNRHRRPSFSERSKATILFLWNISSKVVEERAEVRGEALDLPVCVRSSLHLWSRALGSATEKTVLRIQVASVWLGLASERGRGGSSG